MLHPPLERTVRLYLLCGFAALAASTSLWAAAPAPVVAAEDLSPVRQEIFRRLSVGRRELDQGDAQSAARDLCWASHRALNSRDAAWWCGRALLLARDPEGAVKALRLATEIDPSHLNAWVDLGSALLAAGRPDEARPAFYKALEIRKDYSAAWDGLARLAQKTGDEKQALELFGKALEANPADARARLHRGQLHLEAGRLDQAVADITEAARLRPDDAEVQLGLARVSERARRWDQALQAARRAAAITPKDPRVLALTATIYLGMDALAEAEGAAREALALDPTEPRALLALGEALGRQGKLTDAVAALAPKNEASFGPDDLDDLQRARTRWQAQLDERSRLEGRVQQEDASIDDIFALARIRAATGDFAGAASLAQRAAAGHDESPVLRRAADLLGRADQLTRAWELLARIDARGEASPTDVLNLAVLEERTGDPDRAAESYRRALQTPATAGDAHAGLARLALARDDQREAAVQLQAFLDSGPPAELAERAQEALKRLGAGP